MLFSQMQFLWLALHRRYTQCRGLTRFPAATGVLSGVLSRWDPQGRLVHGGLLKWCATSLGARGG